MLRRIDRDDRRRAFHAREAGVRRRLWMKVHDIERSVLLCRTNPPRRQPSDVQLLTPSPQIEVGNSTGSRGQLDAEHASDDPVGNREVVAQIDVRGLYGRKTTGRVLQEPGNRPMAEHARVDEQHAHVSYCHNRSVRVQSRCGQGPRSFRLVKGASVDATSTRPEATRRWIDGECSIVQGVIAVAAQLVQHLFRRAPLIAQVMGMYFEKDTIDAVTGKSPAETVQGPVLGPLDVHLEQIDPPDPGFVERLVEGPRRDVEVPSSIDDTRRARQTVVAELIRGAIVILKPYRPGFTARRHFEDRHAVQRVFSHVGPQSPTGTRIGLDADDASGATDQVRTGQREIAPVGSHIDESHPRAKDLLEERRLLRLVPACEADLAHHAIAEIAPEAQRPELRRHVRPEGIGAASPEPVHRAIPSRRQPLNQRRGDADPWRGRAQDRVRHEASCR